MAGIALYDDLGAVLRSQVMASSLFGYRVQEFGRGTSVLLEPTRTFWYSTTLNGVQQAEEANLNQDRFRAFVLAVTASPDGNQTSWSEAIDKIAYNMGAGRILSDINGKRPC